MDNQVASSDCLEKNNESGTLYASKRKRQTSIFGHIMRRGIE